MLFGDELWPGESPLVRFEFVHRVRRPVRLGGLGDFRARAPEAAVISKEREAEILRLYHAEKWRVGTIAAQLGVHHTTVRRVLAQAGLARPSAMPRPSMVDPYVPFIVETLAKYPRLPASRLYQMVRERGYRGGARSLPAHRGARSPAPAGRSVPAPAHAARRARPGGLGALRQAHDRASRAARCGPS